MGLRPNACVHPRRLMIACLLASGATRGWAASLIATGLRTITKWATFGQGLPQFRLEIKIGSIWFRSHGIQRLAKEVPRRSGEGDIQDLSVRQTMLPQVRNVLRRDFVRLERDLFGEGHHGDLIGFQPGLPVVG
jgi:hypothetical protein